MFSRIGIVDQLREAVMEEVKRIGRWVLDVWQSQFLDIGVPEHLIRSIETHPAELPLAKGSRS